MNEQLNELLRNILNGIECSINEYDKIKEETQLRQHQLEDLKQGKQEAEKLVLKLKKEVLFFNIIWYASWHNKLHLFDYFENWYGISCLNWILLLVGF